MNPIFNTKNMFYDYFTHLPAMRLKNDFGLGFFEQTVIRNEIQKAIRQAYDHLTASHNLNHVDIYGEIGEQFDEKFYNELKTSLRNHFHNIRSWAFLDDLLHEQPDDDSLQNANFNSRLTSALGYGLKRDTDGHINKKEALIALFNYDLDTLNGRELLYLTKIK